ncbi:IclR family transcriptional regulator [Herbiconiux sp. 11R-BC]|uniref:IclR family transcriptional regulator n=1 Tax=Herbiconiux sp. 11R-BC TaxID=3111637 RepID=UPI003C10AF6F
MSELESGAGAAAPAVVRALRILDYLAESRAQIRTLSDIARELGIAKSSTSNLCAALEEGRLIRRSGGGYVLGRRTVELGSAYLSSFDQVREFYRICEENPALSGRLVQIAMLDGPRVLYLAVYEGQDRFPMSASVGDRYPASSTAVGTALLAELDPGQVAAIYEGGRHLVTFTENSTATLEALQEKLRLTRERGFALDAGEVHPSVVGIAVVIPAAKAADPSFAIGVSLVAPDTGEESRAEVLAALDQAARALTAPVLVPESL